MKRYDAYKDSGIEWIGEIPTHWEVKRLKYIAEARPSNIDKKSKEGETEVFLCNYLDVYNNDFITAELPFMRSTASFTQIEKFSLREGDVIATKDSESPDDIGIAALVKQDLGNVVCGYHLTHIKPRTISGGYLFRQFQSDYVRSTFEVLANGITRYALGVDDFNSLKVIVPLSTEQTAIAAYLDRKTAEIDELIESKRRLLELYEEEKTAIINQAVTRGINPDAPMKDSGIDWLGEVPAHWGVMRVGHCVTVVRGASPRPSGDPRYFMGDFMPWITVKEVSNVNGKFVTSTTESLTREGSKLSRVIEPETLLMSNSGATLGVPKISMIKGCINDGSVAFIDFRDFLMRDFLYLFFASHTEIYREQMKGSGQPNLNTDIIKSTEIALPPLEEQRSIIDYVEAEFDRIITQIVHTKRLIDLLTEYRTALISEVVTGKVRVV